MITLLVVHDFIRVYKQWTRLLEWWNCGIMDQIVFVLFSLFVIKYLLCNVTTCVHTYLQHYKYTTVHKIIGYILIAQLYTLLITINICIVLNRN